MSALLSMAGRGRALRCDAANSHYPTPLRFVWHHILPETCGGKSSRDNLVQVCDLCHVAIHELLWVLRLSAGDPSAWGRHGGQRQRSYALQGWELAIESGTTGQIPNEGGILTPTTSLLLAPSGDLAVP